MTRRRGPAKSRENLLDELANQGARVIEAQVRASEAGDEKSKRILGVALLAIAGGAAAAQLTVASHTRADWPFLILLVGSLSCAGIAFARVAWGYVGTDGDAIRFRIGWDTRELARIAKAKDYTRADVLLANAEALPRWAAHNARLSKRLVSQRITAVFWLFGSGVLLGTSFLYALIRL